MDKAEYWSTKSLGPTFEAVTFDHPSFDAPIRLVANVFAEVTLAGTVHTPAPMTIKPPDQKGAAQPRMTISFPRQVVGRAFKQQLALVAAAGSRDPISVTYAVYLDDTTAPEVTWPMFASDQGGIVFNADAVQVAATLDNPMRRQIAPVYTPDVFTGLEAM